MTEYQKLLEAVANYYGAGSDQWTTIATSSNINSAEWYDILSQTPNVDIVTNRAGEVVSYTVNETWGTVADTASGAVNSNTQVSVMENASNLAMPANNTVSQQGVAGATSGLKEVNGGATVGGVMRSVATAVIAVGAGVRLGAIIDSTLYNANPSFWDERGMSQLNPETWDSIVLDYGEGAQSLFNTFFGIDKTTGKTQPYIDERALAYIAQYMANQGVWDTGDPTAEVDDPTILYNSNFTPQTITMLGSSFIVESLNTDSYNNRYKYTFNIPNDVRAFVYKSTADPTQAIQIYFASRTSQQLPIERYNFKDGSTLNQNVNIRTSFTTKSGTPLYRGGWQLPPAYITSGGVINQSDNALISNWVIDAGAVLFDGAIHQGGGGVTGITEQTGATSPTGITSDMTIDDVIDYLKTVYPTWWDDALYDDVIQPDGTVTRYVYIPTGIPDEIVRDATSGDLHPTGGEDMTQSDPTVDPTDDDLIKTLLEILTSTDPTNPTNTPPTDTTDYPDTGEGNTPSVLIPDGSASALYSIYNPSLAEINALGAWLWSSNFVDQLLKLFNDPMQAIIGLHKIFASPPISGTGNIKVGYLDSGVSANLVSAQYTEVDCGTVELREYFGNALDYTDTEIYLYLPFVGIVPVSVLDVTRASINVKYKVDVLTGACLAQVYVNRDNNAGGQLYCYAGDCAVKYPISSGSYMGIVASVLGIAGSVAGTIASGGAMLPLALGAGATALKGGHADIQHSGSISGNSGAMGIKKPYFIIRRPQTKIADNFRIFNGQSDNVYDVLGNCTGYTRVKYVNLENITATGDELTEIENLLKTGVII